MIIASSVTVASLLIYGLLVGSLTYTKRLPNAPRSPVERRIIGGFWKTANANRLLKQRNLTVQSYFEGCHYDEDRVWPKLARSSGQADVCPGLPWIDDCGDPGLVSRSYSAPAEKVRELRPFNPRSIAYPAMFESPVDDRSGGRHETLETSEFSQFEKLSLIRVSLSLCNSSTIDALTLRINSHFR